MRIRIFNFQPACRTGRFSIFNFGKGQTLIETVTALAVVIILVSALVTMAIASVRSAALSAAKSTAAQLVQQQLEQARNARDVSYTWSAFSSLFAAGGSCLSVGSCYSSCGGGSCVINTGGSTSFVSAGVTYTVSLYGSVVSGNVNLTGVVTWNDSLGPHTERIATIFTNWR